jgi:hypothetical protein
MISMVRPASCRSGDGDGDSVVLVLAAAGSSEAVVVGAPDLIQ